jgi:hypothetical protein
MKNFINQGISLFNWFTDQAAQQVQTACIGASAFSRVFNVSLGRDLKANCASAFKAHQVSFAPISEHDEANIPFSSFALLNTTMILRRPALLSLTSYLSLMELEN